VGSAERSILGWRAWITWALWTLTVAEAGLDGLLVRATQDPEQATIETGATQALIILTALIGVSVGALIALRRLADDPGIHGVDLAVEIGKFGIGADRLFDRTAGHRAIKARLAGKRHHRARCTLHCRTCL